MEKEPKHPWWARLTVSIVMLILAFIGVIVTDVISTGGWNYWKWIVPVYAILALWLSWYERRKKETVSPVTIWHELLHWVALFGAVIIFEVYVQMGFLSRFLASIIALTTLALTVFTLGIYIEWSFMVIGIALALFALIVALFIKFIYVFTIPLLIVAVVILWALHHHIHKRSQKN